MATTAATMVGAAIGTGPVATVYSGLYGGLPVALKVFPGKAARRALSVFEREQGKLRARRVPSVVPVHGVEQLADGRSAVRMELCAQSLAALVRRVGKLEPANVIVLGHAAATALAAAHAAGVVHGGVNPNNVLFRATGEPLLSDFGVTLRHAFARDPLQSVESLPPETLRDDILDQRTDLYGLGVVLHVALTGRWPHPGRLGEHLGERVLRVLRMPVPAINLPGVSVELSTVVGRLLAADPAHRPPNAAVVAGQLATMLAARSPWQARGAGASGLLPPAAGPAGAGGPMASLPPPASGPPAPVAPAPVAPAPVPPSAPLTGPVAGPLGAPAVPFGGGAPPVSGAAGAPAATGASVPVGESPAPADDGDDVDDGDDFDDFPSLPTETGTDYDDEHDQLIDARLGLDHAPERPKWLNKYYLAAGAGGVVLLVVIAVVMLLQADPPELSTTPRMPPAPDTATSAQRPAASVDLKVPDDRGSQVVLAWTSNPVKLDFHVVVTRPDAPTQTLDAQRNHQLTVPVDTVSGYCFQVEASNSDPNDPHVYLSQTRAIRGASCHH